MSEAEANDVRRRMQLLRTSLRTEAKQVAEDVRTVSDWKYYVRQYPWGSVTAAIMAGYMLVPKRNQIISPSPETIAKLVARDELVVQRKADVATKAGVMATLATFVAQNLARAAVGYVKQNVQTALQTKATAQTSGAATESFKTNRYPK